MTGEYGSSVERAEGPTFGVTARRLFGNVRLDFGKDRSPPMLISADLGPCRMSRLAAGAHMVTGDNVALKSYDPDAIKLIFQTRGRSLLHQGSSTVEFDAGRAVVYDPTRAYTLDNPEPVTLFLLQVPRAAIRSRALARLVRPLSATETSAGLQHVLLSMMQSCMTEIDRLDGEARRALGATMVELAKNLMDSEAEIAIAPTARSLDTLRQRIKLCIDANLEQPTLDVAAIARKMGCSSRYIFRAFETEAITPADYLWSQRLLCARARLEDARFDDQSISEIAFGLGFSSSAHFSRAFRQRYDLAPRDLRRRHGLAIASPQQP